MAYQNVGTPRFYINIAEWANSVGDTIPWGAFSIGSQTTGWGGTAEESAMAQHFRTLPVTPSSIKASSLWMKSILPLSIDHGSGFIAFLGHTFASQGIKPTLTNEFPVTPPQATIRLLLQSTTRTPITIKM